MALDRTADDWMADIRKDEEYFKGKYDKVAEIQRLYHGLAYGAAASQQSHNPRNHAYRTVSTYKPMMAFTGPTVDLSTTRSESELRVFALAHAANRWVDDTHYVDLADALADDVLFAYGMTVTGVGPRPGYHEWSDAPYWPQCNRIPLGMSGWDRYAKTFDDARYVFHIVVEDHEDLIERAKRDKDGGWNLDAIRKMGIGAGLDKVTRERETDRNRDEVIYYEVWVPELRIKEENTPKRGYNGVILTFGYGGESEGMEIREPRDFWGPREGPYTLFGTYSVRDESPPLSLLMATYQAARDLNDIARANNSSSQAWKRLIATTNQAMEKALKSGKHDHVYLMDEDDIKAAMATFEVGGLSDQQMAQEMRMDEMLKEDSGLSSASLGNPDPEVTATAESIAASSGSRREGYVLRRWYQAHERQMAKVIWYMDNHDKVAMPLGAEVSARVGYDAALRGGFPKGYVDDHDDLEVRITVGSMGRVTPQQEQQEAMVFMQAASQLGQIGVTLPNVDIGLVSRYAARKLKMPELATVVDPGKSAALAALTLGMQGGMEPTVAQKPQEPRLAVTGQTPGGSGGASAGKSLLPQHADTVGAGSSATATQNRFAKNGAT